jgi:DNA polymerase-3 subunit alpha
MLPSQSFFVYNILILKGKVIMANFVHLGVHSEFSLHDSLIRIKPLVESLKGMGMVSIGIADAGNMFSAIKIYQYAMKAGIKPVIGAEVQLQDQNGTIGKMTLFAINADGYRSLMELISRSFDDAVRDHQDVPIIPIDWLKDHCENMIGMTGARHGILGKTLLAGNEPMADAHLELLKSIFANRLYIELQRTGHPDDNLNVRRSVRLAIRHQIPVVATNGVRFMSRSDFEAHEVRASISLKKTIDKFRSENANTYTNEQYLKTPEEMSDLFSDLPSAIENTLQIARRCSVDITLGKNLLPKFPVPNGSTEADFIRHQSWEGLEDRLIQLYGEIKSKDPAIRKPYEERLEFELNIINQMDFPGYFLIVADFIKWAKNNDVPVGPGRGSGAGSLVAYALSITDLDPLAYDLLFERFLNPERVSMPDFDIDFCMTGRERVIEYVADKYGHKAVSQIVTFGTMAAKSVVRDVARVLGYPYTFGDRIARLIPPDPGTTLAEAMALPELKMLYETDADVQKVLNIAMMLEGITRQVGKHAGGIVIAPVKLTDQSPTYRPADGSGLVTQYYKDDVENAGLVKFDFLGLKTLTIIKLALDSIHKTQKMKGEKLVDIRTIPLDDPKTFQLLQRSETTAVFQLESLGMKKLLHELHVDNFDELIALVALFRPGPMEAGMVSSFVNRKHGREAIEQFHELLEPIMKTTYGVMVYQEQVMQTAQVLSGYSLGEADMLRRAMGKKKPEEMAKQRVGFVQGALKTNGIPEEQSGFIFDLMEKFAGYGFNKSHSAAYALIAYQTAWLKAHYPAHFMAAVMSSDKSLENVVAFKHESSQMGINVLPPHINESQMNFVANSKGEIIYGLSAIKGMGNSGTTIIEERERNGPYTGLLDFCLRCNPNKRVLEAAINCGALDGLGQHRASLMASYPKAQANAKKINEKKNEQQVDMFGDIISEITDPANASFSHVHAAPWSDKQRLSAEKQVLGLFLTGHPIDEYANELKHVVNHTLSELCENQIEEKTEEENARFKPIKVKVAGQVLDPQYIDSKSGVMCKFQLDDNTRRVEVIISSKFYHEAQSLISEDAVLVIQGQLTKDFKTGQFKIFGYTVETVDMIRSQQVSHISVNIEKGKLNKELSDAFKSIIQGQEEGYCPVIINLIDGDNTREIPLEARPVRITDELIIKINELMGEEAARVVYKNEIKNGVALKVNRFEEGEKTRSMRHGKIHSMIESARSAMA